MHFICSLNRINYAELWQMSREVKGKEEREDRKTDRCEDEMAAERGRGDGRKCKTRWENL